MECWHWIAKDCPENIIFHLASKVFEPDPHSLCLLQDSTHWPANVTCAPNIAPSLSRGCNTDCAQPRALLSNPPFPSPYTHPLWTSKSKNVTNEILAEVLWVILEEGGGQQVRSCSGWLSIPAGQAAVTHTGHMCPNKAVRHTTTHQFAEHSTAVSSTSPTNKQMIKEKRKKCELEYTSLKQDKSWT